MVSAAKKPLEASRWPEDPDVRSLMSISESKRSMAMLLGILRSHKVLLECSKLSHTFVFKLAFLSGSYQHISAARAADIDVYMSVDA